MSAISWVPALVPSLDHSSAPLTPSAAEKYSLPLMLASDFGSERYRRSASHGPLRSAIGSVSLPEFESMHLIVAGEKERAVYIG